MAKEENVKARFDLNNLNTLSVVSLATAVTGFGAVAGVITGHVALSQIKSSKQSGRGLAIAGVVVGYVVIALGVGGTLLRVFIGQRYGVEFGQGMMGGWGQDDHGFRNGQGMMGGWGQDDQGPNGNGGMMNGWVTPDQTGTATPAPSTSNN